MIYLDNAAATRLDDRVYDAMQPYLKECYGNPHSFNSAGIEAGKALENARLTVSKILGCNPKEIIFTSGGTESINLALLGTAKAANKRHIITCKTEHHAVLHTLKYLESEGFEVTYLDVDRYGMVSASDVLSALTPNTFLVSVMYANNEVGTINPIFEIASAIKQKASDVLFLTDACQASSLPFNLEHVDLLTLNGSKMHGPKGSGILFVKNGVRIKPVMHGGAQEFALRPGTENVASIVGFAKAFELARAEKVSKKLAARLTQGLLRIPKTFLNGHPKHRLHSNVNVTFLDVEGEAILLHLNEHGICASTGSACTSNSLDPSHVILALGLPYEAAHGSVRFTLSRYTTPQDIDKVLEIMPKIIARLRQLSPVRLSMEEIR